MKDLNQELRRLNRQLASKTREAHELWLLVFQSGDTLDPDARKQRRKDLADLEAVIETLEIERRMVRRALKFEQLAQADEEAPSKPGPQSSMVSTTVNIAAEETVKYPGTDQVTTVNHNGHTKPVARRRGRPRKQPVAAS